MIKQIINKKFFPVFALLMIIASSAFVSCYEGEGEPLDTAKLINTRNGLSAPLMNGASDGTYADRIKITWGAVAGAEIYYIYRDTNQYGGFSNFVSTTDLTSFDDVMIPDTAIYWYKVKAYSSSRGFSTLSAADSGFKGAGTSTLSAPVMNGASDGTYTDRITVSWGAVTGAMQYYLYRDTDQNGTYSTLVTPALSGTSYDDYSAAGTGLYWYKVKAYGVHLGYSDFSNADSGYKGAVNPPDAPVMNGASDGTYTDRITVSWGAVAGADNYYIYRDTDQNGTYSNCVATVIAGVLTYDDASVTDTGIYWYKVKAYSSENGFSDFSNADSGYKMTGTPTLAAPVLNSASDGTYTDRISVSWETVAGADNYYIYRDTDQNGTYSYCVATVIDGVLTYDDASVSDTGTYWYKVKAYSSADGYSDFSNADSGNKAAVIPPAAPATVAASDGTYTDRISVSWGAVAGVDSYYIYRDTAQNGTYSTLVATVLSGTTTYDDTSAAGTGVYWYKVKAHSSEKGFSDFSNADSGYKGTINPPDAPVMNGASDGTSTMDIVVTWQAVTGADFYYLYRDTVSDGTYSTLVTIEPGLSWGDGTCDYGKVYYYKVKAYSSTNGFSDFSGYDSGFKKLGVTSSIDATLGTYTDKVTVTWSEVAGATSYDLYRDTSLSGPFTEKIGSDLAVLTYDDSAVTAGNLYYYKVQAKSIYTGSSGSGDLSGANSGYVKLEAPLSVDASDAEYSAKVNIVWSAVTGATSYDVYRDTAEILTSPVKLNSSAITILSFDDTTAVPGTTYWYRVVARCGGAFGDSAYSDANDGSKNALNNWTIKTGPNTARSLCAMAAVGGKLYVIGGYNNGSYLQSVESYDPSTDTWTAKTNMPTARGYMTAAVYNDTIYVISGLNDSGATNKVEAYNPVSNTWTTRASLPAATYIHAAVTVNGKIYVMGGAMTPTSLYVYDPSINTWSSGKSIPESMSYCSASVVNNKIYAFYQDKTYEYDPATETWTKKSSMITSRDYICSAVLNGKINVLGGSSTLVNEEYDPAANTWTTKTNMPFTTTGGMAAEIDGKIYIIDGNQFAVYTPSILSISRPLNVNASDGSYTDRINISWDAVSGADSYNIYRDTAPSGTFSTLIGSATTNSYDDTTADAGVTYWYKVRSVSNINGTSGYSDYNSGYRANAGLSAPANVQATITLTDKITVSWESVTNADYYFVYRDSAPDGNFLEYIDTVSGATSFDDMSALAGQNYYYRVKAFSSAHQFSYYSDVVTGFRVSTNPLSAPGMVGATDGTFTDRIRIYWSEVSGAENYYIYRDTDQDGYYEQCVTTVTSGTTSYEDTSVTDTGTYWYKVKAYSTARGFSEYSTGDSGYKAAGNALTSPVITGVTKGFYSDRINVTWETVTGATNYYIYRDTVQNGTFADCVATVGEVLTYDDTTALPGTIYWYKVKAYSAGVFSDFSIGYSGALRLQKPVVTADSSYIDHIALTWPAVTGAVTYDVYREIGMDGPYMTKVATDITDAFYNDTAVAAGPVYYYIVIAKSMNFGQSDLSSSVTGCVRLLAPDTVDATDGEYANMINIAWSSVANSSGYRVYRDTLATGTFSEQIADVTAGTTSWDDTTAVRGQDYYYKVCAVSALGGNGLLSDAEMGFLRKDDYWTTKTDMPTARSLFVAVEVNGKIYAIGGYDGTDILNTVEEYNPASDTWSTKTAMPTARYQNAAAAVSGKIYVIGGYDDADILDTVEEYDPSNDTWSIKTSMPTARHSHEAVAVNGKIYVIGGVSSGGYLHTVEEYDPSTDIWSTKTSMPTARHSFASAAINGKIYALGGSASSGIKKVEVYDPSADLWETKTDMGTARYNLSAAVINGKIYAIGGSDVYNLVQEYNPLNDTWSTKTYMTIGRCFLEVVAVDGKIYVIGGVISVPCKTVEEYTPPFWDGLMGEWLFTAGSAKDTSQYSNNGTAYNTTTTTDRFNSTSALSFNGTTSYLLSAGNSGLGTGNKSISVWINTPSWVSTSGVYWPAISVGNQSAGAIFDVGIANETSPSGNQFYSSNWGNSIFCNTPSVNNDTWYHIVLNYNSTNHNYDIYINGVIRGSKIMTSSLVDTQVNIGNSIFNGKIDDVRIFNRMLTATEISTLYHEGGW